MAWAHELSVAFRSLRRSRTLAITVALMLGVAIGAVTAIYSIAHAVLLRPLPIADPDNVLLLWGHDDARSQSVVEVGLADLRAWRAGQRSLSAIEVFGSVNWGELRVTAPGEPFGAVQNAVSAGFFEVFGARPLLGRTFRPDDDVPNAPRTVVLSGDLWQRRFGSDPGIVGTVLTAGEGPDATAFEIIGVMPPEFRIPSGAEVWIAIVPNLAEAARAQNWDFERLRAMYAVGRLAPGATPDEAVAELSTIARNEEIAHGAAGSRMAVVATPVLEHLLGPARPALLAIAGAAAMLLLIGCANAAGLLLVHAAARRREVAVRLALGARRWQIARQRFCEALLLSLLAGALGVALAYASFDAIVAMAPIEVPRLGEAAVDGRALLFALAVSLLTAVAVTLLPAWRHTGGDLAQGLQDRSERGTTAPASARIRKVLVAAQIAAAVVLLTAAGLFARSFVALLRLDLGFNPDNVLTFHLAAYGPRYDAQEKRWDLVDAVLDRTVQVPNVAAAGAIYQRPFAHGPIGMDTNVVIEGQPLTAEASSRNPILNWEAVTPGYFRAMEIRLLQGRLFDDRDNENAPSVVIVSDTLAERLWPGEDAVGRRLIAYGSRGTEEQPDWQTVVGIVESARYREVETPRFDLYLPHRQAPSDVQHYMVRVAGDPLSVVPQLRTALATIDPEITLEGVSTMNQIVRRVLAPWRFSTVVVSAFSVLALLFAAVGLAALMAYAVAQRTREIGVRMALGARPPDIVSLLLREGTAMSLAGLAAGIVVAWSLRRTIESMLFGVRPDDAVTFSAVAIVLLGVALLAAYIPVRRAARIDPAVALRHE
jgi:putative ABC transport system permease protein